MVKSSESSESCTSISRPLIPSPLGKMVQELHDAVMREKVQAQEVPEEEEGTTITVTPTDVSRDDFGLI